MLDACLGHLNGVREALIECGDEEALSLQDEGLIKLGLEASAVYV